MSDIKQYEPLWGSWTIDATLGEGSFGKVYRVKREDFGRTYYSAVKIITVPQSEADLRSVREDLSDDASVRSYYRSFVSDLIGEIDLMESFKGTGNIVAYEDHRVVEHTDDFGYDILIRMELLESLSARCADKPLSEREVVKLGIDICRALEVCAVKNVIHRDIKPDNIFVNSYGDFKLGDFGIARQAERTMSGLSKKGTYTYMAPEVYRGEEYGASVDIYSLGIVLYRLLNKNRVPFMPEYPAAVTPKDRDASLGRRMSGEVIAPIKGVGDALNAVVLKACAYDRRERFSTAAEMKSALEAVLSGATTATAPEMVAAAKPEPSVESMDGTMRTEGVFATPPKDATIGHTEATEGVFFSRPALDKDTTEKTSTTEGAFADTKSKPKHRPVAPISPSLEKDIKCVSKLLNRAMIGIMPLFWFVYGFTKGNWFDGALYALTMIFIIKLGMFPLTSLTKSKSSNGEKSVLEFLNRPIIGVLLPFLYLFMLTLYVAYYDFMYADLSGLIALLLIVVAFSIGMIPLIFLKKIKDSKKQSNVYKYLVIIGSSNFSMMISMLVANVFMAYLPIYIHLILLRILLILCCISLLWDKTDTDFLAAPGKRGKSPFARFALTIGFISSLFDIAAYSLIYFMITPIVAGDYVAYPQPGFFVASLCLQIFSIHLMRTTKIPFIQSRSSAAVMLMSCASIATGIFIAVHFYSIKLPTTLFIWLALLVALQTIFITIAKNAFYEKSVSSKGE